MYSPLTSLALNKKFPFAFAAIHIFALTAFFPYVFAWWGFPVVLVGNFIFGSLGINLGFHRMLAHKSVCFSRALQRLFVLLGVCCLEGSPLWWVVIHRIHHSHSDRTGDPHTPRDGLYWAHLQWIYSSKTQLTFESYASYAPDLVNDPYLRWFHRSNRWAMIYLAHAVIILAFGLAIGTLITNSPSTAIRFGTQFFVWAVLVRTVYVWHVTWLVNSATHCWGYRNFDTPDKSHNNILVAILTNGEGWHNNHHAYPRACSHGQSWWEIDLTYSVVRLLQSFELAWDVIHVPDSSSLSHR